SFMETPYITHPACKLHEMGDWHPECPARLDAIHDQLVASGLLDFLDEADAPVAAEADLLRVHTAAHLDYLRSHAPKQGYFPTDAGSIMNPPTLEAAAVAAGAGSAAVDAVLGGSHQTAFCAVRPPGHHARPAQAMG